MLSVFLLSIPLLYEAAQAVLVPLNINNQCPDTIWPAISTQAGNGPSTHGFVLKAGLRRNLTVDTSWNGRVWGRTNCTFDASGQGMCGTGDCGGNLSCTVTGAASTLAEFNLAAYMNQSFYDISLVDGYNLPLAIVALLNSSNINKPASNSTNPSCVGSAEGLASFPFNPYNSSRTRDFLGTTSSDPLPFDSKTTLDDVLNWCPPDLLQNQAKKGQPRPAFNPCLSACAKRNEAKYCCIGKYSSAKKCGPNYYSKAAKEVCPDAYSYAFDDASSTFAVPTGSGFEIVFCPGGRSTTIQKTLGKVSAASGFGVSMRTPLATMMLAIVVAGFG